MSQIESSQIAKLIAGIAVSESDVQSMDLPVKGPRTTVFEGEPVESVYRFYDDGVTLAGIWECTPGRFPVVKEDSISTMFFLSGAGTITDQDGESRAIEPGGVFVEPQGWRGEWHITETVRKIYVITRSTPS
jgi:uncharacterized protein